MQWTNRDGIQTSPAPVRPIPAEQTLADALKGRDGQGIAPNDGVNAPIGQPVNNVGEIAKVGDSVNAPISRDAQGVVDAPAVDDAVFWNKVKSESGFSGDIPSLQADVESGKFDTSNMSPLLKMNLQRFAEARRLAGADPTIPAGMKERGVSENIRTDANRPDELRDSYSADPMVYKQVGNKETLAKAQSIFDKGIEPAITELDGLIKDLKPEAAPLVKMIADKLTTDGNIARARELLSNAANRATEAGQYGQAFRILRDADPETFLMTFDKQLNKLNKEGLEQYGKKWNNVELSPDELTLVSNIERGNQASYDAAFEQIQARIANGLPASAFEKINAWRHISMLLNPKTQIRNVLGNGIMMGMRKSAQSTSGVIQKVFLKEADRTQSILVNKEYKQLASDYFETNKKDLLGGSNKYNESISLNMPDKRVFRKSRIGEKLGVNIDALEQTRKFTYDMLQKGDNPFFRNSDENRLAAYAQAKGVKDFSQLSEEAFSIAKTEAEQATYKER